jgi:serine/threonine protein kinase
LLDGQDSVKICDFGISKRMFHNQVSFEHIGTPVYLAPEIISDQGYSGFGVDVGSLAVTSYIALTGEVPFRGNTINELKKNISVFEFNRESVAHLGGKWQRAFEMMFIRDPLKRASLLDISDLFGE